MSNILLVDDNVDLLKVQSEFLRRSQHTVSTATNGNAALRIMDQMPFDLVITDLIMPEKEGIETIQELRRNFPSIKIIAVSGGGRVSGMDYLPLATKLGANATLEKPFSGKQLLELVDKVMSGLV